MRYQLIRTTPYLSGQVRWDIPLTPHYENGEYKMDTPELHIVPLNDNISFNEDNSWVTLKYTHLENLKHLFGQIGGNFWDASGEWSGPYWLYNQGVKLDPYSHVFIMGARRMPFRRYGKQISFLCPLWISEETNPELFEFEMDIRVHGEERDHIIRRRFGLSKALCEYMADYLNKSARYVEPDPISETEPAYLGVDDSLLNIKFDPDEAFITGVDVSAARYAVKNIRYMVDSITKRELPMMEFDNNLLFNFKENYMIAQQLINLNFTFNVEDISFLPKETLLGKNITISLHVIYDGNYLELKDFYTNYSRIPVYRTDFNTFSLAENACEHLGDNRIIDYMHANKFTQPIFHWSMVENPGYIYNFNDGFAPTFMSAGELYCIQGRYYDQADISKSEHTVYNNAAHWCEHLDLTGYSANGIISNIMYRMLNYNDQHEGYSELIINEDSGIAYLQNNRFDLNQLWNDGIRNVFSKYNLHFSNLLVSTVDLYNDTDPNTPTQDHSHYYWHNADFGLFILWKGDDLYFDFLETSTSEATLKRITNWLEGFNTIRPEHWVGESHNDLQESEHWTDELQNDNSQDDIMSDADMNAIRDFMIHLAETWIPPYRVDFRGGIITHTVEKVGDQNPTELNMFKTNDSDAFVLRYTGRLCPIFINPNDRLRFNLNYPYIQWNNINDPKVQYYNKMLKTGFTPDYPSIDFYTYEEQRDTIERPEFYQDWVGDICWKNDGRIIALPERYVGTKIVNQPIPYNEDNVEEDFWVLLYPHISQIMNVQITESLKRWIHELYTISYDFDYLDERNINDIIYTIEFNLK